MKEEIDKAIKCLLGKISKDTTADEALKYTQSVLNISHAKTVLEDLKKRQ